MFSVGTRPCFSGKQLASSAGPELYTPCGGGGPSFPLLFFFFFSHVLMYMLVYLGVFGVWSSVLEEKRSFINI